MPKLALEKNTTDLRQMLEQSDELMRVVMEAGDLETAEKAAEEAARAAAALIVRKQGVRELAKRVRERVAGDDESEDEAPSTTTGSEAPTPDTRS